MIPGLGFDDRIFQKINLPAASTYYLNWIEPAKGESIESYAGRMSGNISNEEEKVVLVGHSFGGIICQEIAKQRSIDKIVLVSSIVSRKENPLKFKIIHPSFLHKLITKELILSTFRYWDKQHGFETKEEQALFRQMVPKHTNNYFSWALRALSRWNNLERNKTTKVVRIHGRRDKTFPFHLVSGIDYEVEDGSHFMVYKQGELIGQILQNEIKKE